MEESCKYEGKIAEMATDIKYLVKSIDDLKNHYATKTELARNFGELKGDVTSVKWMQAGQVAIFTLALGVLRFFQ